MRWTEYQYAILEWSSPLAAGLLFCAAIFIGIVLVVGYANRPADRKPKHKRKGKHE